MVANRSRPVAALIGDPDQIQRVYGDAGRDRLASFTDLRPGVVTGDPAAGLAGVRWAFSTWGMPRLEADTLARLPDLEVLFYAAGTVKGFAGPMLDRGVRVVSAWKANGRPVAEFSLAQILLASKNYFGNSRSIAGPWDRGGGPPVGPGVWDTPVALLGFGAVGRMTAELLGHFRFDVRVVDPFVDDAVLDAHGARRIGMEEAFASCEVVSNHLPDLPSLRHALTRDLFASMRPGATFLNTGRGAQVDEEGLVGVLRERPDLTALLDVTAPEPPVAGSPLYDLPNAHLSSHIAGSLGREVRRLSETVLDEAEALLGGGALQHEIHAAMLDTMA
ncbi:hydroxyacid dehydrogenase [Phycisphaera mikurensis]|uniref:Putative oxidoreductase n=1 Tax=Phycisphaera mikurensis (strain NBRC 102666 / KCTC 22515 / FYK2301M01) TaxID=1142394 RepID=I0IAC1_PHYMF|nr:hydroxyacid dehydrogenase [Phycisphaera mikurensis]MBB6441792.1 phosphoglycerate dehydrogenase-like enzyme [Phycisphaera mikurensis]BAM02209.1 putative oxidoreductase [Phycisphaera mikurensis NBRC 102666]